MAGMNRPMKGFICAALLTLSAGALADAVHHSRVEAALASYPNFEDEFTLGVVLRGSALVHQDWLALGGVTALEGDNSLVAAHAGGAWRYVLDASTDLWAGATLEYQDFETEQCRFEGNGQGNTCSHESVDDFAPGLRAGLRHQFHRDLEGEVGARYVTGDLDYLGLTATGRYRWLGDMDILAEVDFYDGNFGLIGGVSLRF